MFKATHLLVGTALGVSLLVEPTAAATKAANLSRTRAYTTTFAQLGTGNTINGFVFGSQRLPIGDLNVELLDEFNRTIDRTKTNGAGRYFFTRIGPGRY